MEAVTKVTVSGLTKTFYAKEQPVSAIEGLNFAVPDGQFWCVIGPSGCGKTTLLRILAGLEQQTSGSIELTHSTGDRPLNSMVFQEQSVFPWLTVWENVAWGLRCRRVPRKQIETPVRYYLEKMGLWAFRDAYPHQLSGGMKQRVSVARAFVNDPEILLMDEPFGSLDEQTRGVLQEELLRLWEETKKTVIFITHSLDEALLLSDKILVLSKRPGRVKEIVDVEFPRPRSLVQVRNHPAFAHLFTHLWNSLHAEGSPHEEHAI